MNIRTTLISNLEILPAQEEDHYDRIEEERERKEASERAKRSQPIHTKDS